MKPYYSEAGIEIYHGDCRQILPQLGKFDLLLTDPPYGIGADSAQHKAALQRIAAAGKSKAGRGWVDYGPSNWDAAPPSGEVISAAVSACKKAVVWGGNYFDLPISMGWLVWDKGQRDFSLADGELAWTSEKRALRIFDYSRGAALQDGRVHPTQKPLALMKWCLSLFPDARSVLDPFCGSGTTLVAAKDMGLSAVGIEAEERYCEIAANRLRQSVLNFEETPCVT